MILLTSEESIDVHQAKIVLISEGGCNPCPFLLVISLYADNHLGVSTLEILDEESERIFGSLEQELLGELREQMAELVLLDECFGVCVSLEGLLFVHCSYITIMEL